MSDNNLGRVQGGGFYSSTSESTTSIEKTTVLPNGVLFPLEGDIIVNANGDLCKIVAITSTAYTVTKHGTIKGAKGDNGADGEPGPTKQATSSVLGGIKLVTDEVQGVAANSPSAESGRTYPVQLNDSGQAVVNVPSEEGKYSISYAHNIKFSMSTTSDYYKIYFQIINSSPTPIEPNLKSFVKAIKNYAGGSDYWIPALGLCHDGYFRFVIGVYVDWSITYGDAINIIYTDGSSSGTHYTMISPTDKFGGAQDYINWEKTTDTVTILYQTK